MQIIFAAPFILAAGILFTALTAIPRVRRWAIPIPTGVIAAGPSSLLVFLLDAFIRYRFGGRIGPADRWDLAAFIAGGAIGGVLAGTIAWFVICAVPQFLLRLAVFFAGWCSYFVVIAGLSFAVDLWLSRSRSLIGGVLVLLIEMLLSFVAAWFIPQRSEQFRPRRIRLPSGMSFRNRRESPSEPRLSN
jgi:hypothetical protein